eukprot:9456957-Pyramimonas_sp.AAC.1
MRAALKREPHFERHPPSIRESLANLANECTRRSSESHILKTTRPPSVMRLPMFKLQGHKWPRGLMRNARPALNTGLG